MTQAQANTIQLIADKVYENMRPVLEAQVTLNTLIAGKLIAIEKRLAGETKAATAETIAAPPETKQPEPETKPAIIETKPAAPAWDWKADPAVGETVMDVMAALTGDQFRLSQKAAADKINGVMPYMKPGCTFTDIFSAAVKR